MWINNTLPITEGDRIDFTCVVTGTPKFVNFESSFLDGEIASWIIHNNSCVVFRSPNRTLFDASCDISSLTFSMSILSASYSYHQLNVTCEASYSGSVSDNVEGFVTIKMIDKYCGAWLTTQTTQLQTTNPGPDPIITTTTVTDPPDVSTSAVVNISNDVSKQILIFALVSILLVEVCQCVAFAIMYRKGIISFTTSKKLYEDVVVPNQEAPQEEYSTINNSSIVSNLAIEHTYNNI
ncbi:uncharacterized protein [Mytilus edulis]|uniref:uncharacterized protein isoform X1 n=1 Tax=Mytilus edulis TaxID=6550 RepID=UPI0039F1489A